MIKYTLQVQGDFELFNRRDDAKSFDYTLGPSMHVEDDIRNNRSDEQALAAASFLLRQQAPAEVAWNE